MRPIEVENEDIILAGEELVKNGINVSGFQLRKSLGKGTPARLFKVWNEHSNNTEQVHEQQQDLPIEAPTALTAIANIMPLIENVITANLTSFIDTILTQQQKEHSFAIESVTKQFQIKENELTTNLVERDEYIINIESDNERFQDENDNNAQLIVKLENSLESTTARINEFELQEKEYRTEIITLNKEVSGLNKTMLNINNEINTEKNTNHDLLITIATNDEKIKSLIITNNENKEIIKNNNSELRELTEEVNKLSIDLATHKSESSSYMNELSKEKLNSVDLQSRNEKLIAELATLKYQLEQKGSKRQDK